MKFNQATVLLCLGPVTVALAPPADAPRGLSTRSDFLASASLALSAPGLAYAASAGALYPATQLLDELAQLRSDVRAGKIKTPQRVFAARDRTLEPLRNAMEKNPLNQGNDKAALQPLLMKGHMLELDQALASGEGFKTYVSKTTGDTYPGGKVERELEEAVETARDYCDVVNCDMLLVYR